MAVYTEVSDEDLTRFVAEYDIGTVVSCKGIAEGVENSNFLLQTSRATFILTLYERRVKVDDLPYFLGLMEHLARAGIACPIPLQGRDGRMLRTLCDRPATIVTFLTGMSAKRVLPAQCRALGGILAQLHRAGQDYPKARRNTLSVHDWRPLFKAEEGRIDSVLPGLADEIRRELDHLESRWPAALPEGVIHADLFPDNVFFRDDHLSGVIDFYFSCTDFLAYDIAICLNAWCFEDDGAFNITKAQHLVSAYGAIRPLSPEEKTALPLLARGAAIRFLLTRLYDWFNTPAGVFVKPKNPLEYVRKMRFHRTAQHPEAYGIIAA
ncbi:MAG: homoserine kinase type II [Rhodospirillaceae bacterium]|nr:MAG: homoserine kinase type II [Rhodospirillaceae bacterium]